MSPARPKLSTSDLRMTFMTDDLLGCDERQERQIARPLDGLRQLTLVPGAGAGHPAGQDLAALRGERAQDRDLLEVDVADLLRAEAADLAARGERAATARPGRSR